MLCFFICIIYSTIHVLSAPCKNFMNLVHKEIFVCVMINDLILFYLTKCNICFPYSYIHIFKFPLLLPKVLQFMKYISLTISNCNA